MADEEYYAILEVDRSASGDDIKKSYRRQALRWHPDKNPDNKEEAEARFKKIAEAYEVLSDPNKRAVYDRYGKRGLENGGANDNDDGAFAFAGNGFFPFGARPQGRHGHGFVFSDPFELFRQVFGDNPFMSMRSDYFADIMMVSDDLRRSRNGAPSAGVVQQFGAFPGFGMSLFSDDPFGGTGNLQIQSFSSAGGFGGGGGSFRSVSSSTRYVNGKPITTVRTVENGVETVRIDEDGVVKSIKVDGVEQMVEFRPQRQNQSHSHSHSRSHQNGHDAAASASTAAAAASSSSGRRSTHNAYASRVDPLASHQYYAPGMQQYEAPQSYAAPPPSSNMREYSRKPAKTKKSKNTNM